MLLFNRRSCFDLSVNVLGFSSATLGSPLREQSTHSEVFFGWNTISYRLGQRLLRGRSFFNIWSGLAMQVIEESIDVKSMKPSLLTQRSVHGMMKADDNNKAMRST